MFPSTFSNLKISWHHLLNNYSFCQLPKDMNEFKWPLPSLSKTPENLLHCCFSLLLLVYIYFKIFSSQNNTAEVFWNNARLANSLHEGVLIFFVVFNLLPHSWWDLISTKQNNCHCPTHKYCKWVHLNQNICHYQHVRLWCLWHSTLISCCLSTYNGYSFRFIFFLSKIQNFTECNLIVLSFQDNWFLIKSFKDIQQLDLLQNITRNRHYISKSLLKLLCK